MNGDLMSKLHNAYAEFSKGQKAISRYMIEHYDKAAFMTANRLGEVVGVSESTVVRFAVKLGYEGYPELQKALQDMIRNRLTSVQRLEVTTDKIGQQNILQTVMQDDMEKISMTLSEVNHETFDWVVQELMNAKRIYIVGARSSGALANFMGFYFNLLFDNVRVINENSVSDVFEQILRVEKGDVVVGISFPRYSSRTIKALQYAKNQDASVIAITDSMLSPITKYATCSLFAKSDMASFVDSLVAPLSLINALIVAIGVRQKNSIADTFTKLESIWDEYGVYEKNDEEA